MARMTIREMRQQGVSQSDIDIALDLQRKQRANGVHVHSLEALVGLRSPAPTRSTTVVDLTDRAMRRRGVYDQAALMLDQRALSERSPERAIRAREAASIAKALSASQQLEFDFFGGGNVSIAHQYQDAITERLYEAASTTTKAKEAGWILWTITRHLIWQSYECSKTASDLCDITRTDKAEMARALDLLERVGAIRRVKRGRTKLITVTPEGAFRGDVNKHAETVERYRLEVIEGGKSDE